MTFSPTLYRKGTQDGYLLHEADLGDQPDLLRKHMASDDAKDDGYVAGLLDGLMS